MITVDIEQFKELEKDLKTFHSRAFPFATRETLTQAAFKSQQLARKDVRIKMVTRNKFTEKSILFKKAKTLNIRRQSASVGSIADYMEAQEFGGVKRKAGSEGVAIPTSFSAGQGRQKSRTKVAGLRNKNNIRNIRLKGRARKSRNRKQALLFKMQDAVKSGNRFIFHDFGGGRKKGIFRVVGGSRNSKRDVLSGSKLEMVYDLTEQTVNIPKLPWLKPVIDTTQILMPAMYRKAVLFQAKRLGLFK